MALLWIPRAAARSDDAPWPGPRSPARSRYPSVACGAPSGLASVRGIVPAGVQTVYLVYPNGASVQANVTRGAYVFIVPSPARVGGWPEQLRYNTQDNGTAHAIELPSGAFARCLAAPQTHPATTADQPQTAKRAVRAHLRLFSIPQAASVSDSIQSEAPFGHKVDGRLEPSAASRGFDLADAREVRSDVSGVKRAPSRSSSRSRASGRAPAKRASWCWCQSGRAGTWRRPPSGPSPLDLAALQMPLSTARASS